MRGSKLKYKTLFLILLLILPNTFAQWQNQLSGTDEDLNDVAVLSQSNAVVVGNNGIILKTTDSGSNWILMNSGTTSHLNAVSFRNEQNGIAVGNGVICRTSDGGDNWLISPNSENLITVSYREPFFGIPILIGSNNGKLFASGDDGNSWCDTVLFPSEQIIAVGFNYYTPNLHAPATYAAAINYTSITYTPCSNPHLYENPINVVEDTLIGGEFSDYGHYLIGYVKNFDPIPLLLVGTGWPTVWEPIYSFVPAPYVPLNITSIGQDIYVCGSDGKIFKSTDRGDNWFEQTTGTNNDLKSISFWNDVIGYSVGKDGIILYTSNGGVSSVDKIQQPIEYYLHQNYPNPFNPTTYIRYGIAESGYISLKVYDVLGNELITLVNEEKTAGEYMVKFNSKNLASGIYFYELKTKEFIQIKKMVLTR
jgi:hypothetical protein